MRIRFPYPVSRIFNPLLFIHQDPPDHSVILDLQHHGIDPVGHGPEVDDLLGGALAYLEIGLIDPCSQGVDHFQGKELIIRPGAGDGEPSVVRNREDGQ